MTDKPLHKPASAVNAWTGIIGAFVFCAVAWFLKATPYKFDLITDCFLILGSTAVVMALYEILVVKVYRHEETGLEWGSYIKRLWLCWQKTDLYVKLLGLLLSVGLMLFVYQLPNYQDEYYAPFFDFLFSYAGIIIAVGFLYFFLIHPAARKSRDELWHFGACLIPWLWKDVNVASVKKHIFSLCIKMFFLPLMFIFFIEQWQTIKGMSFSPNSIKEFFDISFHSIFFLDVALATIGYVFTLRLFNAHIRWPEMRWGGWLFCLICYAPFNHVIFGQFLNYHDELDWNDWIGEYPVLYIIWGSAILISNSIYVYATVNFGLRFSNLTHRGILTHGAYSFTKHPAYIFKNLAWWLGDMPFLATSFLGALKNTLLIMLVNIVYFMRAKYEEKMLLEDPVYKQYYAYIEENGLFARLKKIVNVR